MQSKIPLNDLKCSFYETTSSYLNDSTGRDGNEQGKKRFFSTDGISASLRVSKVCSKIQWRIQSQKFFLHGPFFDHVVCTIDLQRKSERYDSMPECSGTKTLSYGDSHQTDEKQSCSCECKPGLENLSGICHGFDQKSDSTLRRHSPRFRIQFARNGLCSGFYYYRPLPFSFSVGKVPETQRSCKASYSPGVEKYNATSHLHDSWQSSRRSYFRSFDFGTRSYLRNVQSICGFWTALPILQRNGNLCDKSEKELRLQANQVFAQKQKIRDLRRPNRKFEWGCSEQEISNPSQTYKFSGVGNRQTFCFSYKQFSSSSRNHRFSLQLPLENRDILQMDQAESPNQKFFRNNSECSKNSNLDCCSHICFGRNREKTIGLDRKSLHNLPNFEYCNFRKRTC